MERKRNTQIDIFKGICIILMVMGHAWAPFTTYIYLFHIPAFFVASGYTYRSGKDDYFKWIGKKAIGLLVPFLIVNFIFIGIYELLELLGLYSIIEAGEKFQALEAMGDLLGTGLVLGFGGAMWFVPVLFLCSVMYRTVDELGSRTTRKSIPILSLIIFLCGWFYVKEGVSRPWYIDLAMLAVGFFAFGRWLAEKQVLEQGINHKILLPFAMAVTWFFGIDYYFDMGISMNWPVRHFDRDLFMLLLSSVLAMYYCYRLAGWLEGKGAISALLTFLGQRTYVVLAWHFVIFKLEIVLTYFLGGRTDVEYLKESVPPYRSTGVDWLVYSVVAIAVCMLLSKAAEMTRVTNYIFNARLKPGVSLRKMIAEAKATIAENGSEAESNLKINQETVTAARGLVKKTTWEWQLLCLVLAGALFSVGWMLSGDNGFLPKDYLAILNVKTRTYYDIFSFLPGQRYDFCIPDLFLKLLYRIFGLNIQGYHFAYVALHFTNIVLVYKILRSYLLKKLPGRQACACVGAAVFGIYPISLLAVGWIAAGNEVVCAFFYLLCILFYFKGRVEKQYQRFHALLCVLCFYLALRSGQLAVVLPVLGLLYELKQAYEHKKLRISRAVIVGLLGSVLYTMYVFAVSYGQEMSTDIYGAESYHPILLLKSAVRYLVLYFDWNNASCEYNGLHCYGYLGIGGVVAMGIYSLVLLFRKKQASLFCALLMVPVSIGPMLSFVGSQNKIYLYIPSIFVGICIALLLGEAAPEGVKKHGGISVAAAVAVLMLINYVPSVVWLRDSYFNLSSQDAKEINQIKVMEALPEECNVYIRGVEEKQRVLRYDAGAAVKLFLNNATIQVELVDSFPEEVRTPYVFWEYEEGKLVEVKRDETPPEVFVTKIYPDTMVKGQATDVAIVCEKISPFLVVCVDGVKLPTIVGADFISATVPGELLQKDKVTLQVLNEENGGVSKIHYITFGGIE